MREMPPELGSSGPIDRDSAGETPEGGSTFTLVEPIPRGPAIQHRWFARDWKYYGGRPRCPVCLKSKTIHFTGYRSKLVNSNFHCIRCLVAWFDPEVALCFVCDAVFQTERNSSKFTGDPERQYTSTCYHLNVIEHPFCPKCEAIIGVDKSHSRRELRRRVGLRKSLNEGSHQ